MKKRQRNSTSIIILLTIIFLMSIGTVVVFRDGSIIFKTAWGLNQISGQIQFLQEKPARERWEYNYDEEIIDLNNERQTEYYQSENKFVRWFSNLGTEGKLIQYTILIVTAMVWAATAYIWIDVAITILKKTFKRKGRRKQQRRRASA